MRVTKASIYSMFKEGWPFVIIAVFSVYYFYLQKPMPLVKDQLTYGTIIEYIHNDNHFERDPLWGKSFLKLPLNFGILAFDFLSKITSIEEGIIIGLTILMFTYLAVTYWVFWHFCGSSILALPFTLLSALPVSMPGSTFWGIGFSDTFLSRTIVLPLVPMFFYFFTKVTEKYNLKALILFYLFLGFTFYIHQVSSLYLFLAFISTMFCVRPTNIKMYLLLTLAYFISISPFLLYFYIHLPIDKMEISNISSFLVQKWLQIRFSWAFNPRMGYDIFQYILKNPIHILVLLVTPILLGEDKNLKLFRILTVSIILTTLSLFWIQDWLYKIFGIPFKFIQLGRGFRFLHFITFLYMCIIWKELRLSLSRKINNVLLVLIVVFSISLVVIQYKNLAPKARSYTCSDSIFSKIRKLSSDILLATDDCPELRYCSKHSVYVIFKDGGIAFHNGNRQFLEWVRRYITNHNFFKSLDKSLLEKMKSEGVTHLCVRRKLPSSILWRKVACSSRYCLYEIK